jgi:aryl-alcohol dehydrogenase-like predicted oxidoreductase
MQYRRLRKTGIEVSALALGAGPLTLLRIRRNRR